MNIIKFTFLENLEIRDSQWCWERSV